MKKNIIITGTSRGIGLEMVKQFAEQGHQVLALSREIKSIQNLQFANVHCFSFDISCQENYQTLTDFLQKWQSVDILINNAGKLIKKPFENISVEEFLSVYQVNVFGVVRMIQSVLPFSKKGTTILNISSMGGVQGSIKFAGLSAYSSSKGALITLTELLAQEYQEKGIIFNNLALGAVQTEMLQEAFPDYKAQVNPSQMASYIVDFVLNRSFLFSGKTIQVANTTP